MNQSKEILIAGIEADARQEEERVLAEAGQQAAEKRKYGDQKVDAVLADARQRADTQSAEIRRKAQSGVELEVRRRALRLRDAVVQDLLARVEEQMRTRIADPDYRKVLLNWIVEAARGLNVAAAEVNAAAGERALMDEALLREAMERLEHRVELTLSEADPLNAQGIVLTSLDGRMAFNNQVRTRIQRHRREIQGMIHETLFEN
jgi:vacuolar-type H+-ATPase subunit E/Vma4